MEQATLPEVPPVPNRTLLTALELQEIRKKLIEGDGKIEALGEKGMEIMRDVIYTCRMMANPMQEDPEKKKEKKAKGTSTDRKAVKGVDVNNLLGGVMG